MFKEPRRKDMLVEAKNKRLFIGNQEKNMASKKNNVTYALLSFILPIVFCLVLFFIEDVYPFGDRTTIYYDANQQFTRFLVAWKRSILEGDFGFYSLYAFLGENAIGAMAYYVMSPFNLILLFFNDIVAGITFITLMKIGCCGFTMYIFVNKEGEEGLNREVTLLLSLCYAVGSYNIIYMFSIIWMDGVLALPLVVLGLIRMKNSGRISKLYIISLVYCIIANYYIGYMVCIMTFFYFVYLILLEKKTILIKNLIKNFIISSLLVGMICAVLLVPVILSLKGTKANFDPSSFFSLENIIKPWFALSKMYPGTWTIAEAMWGSVDYYCGTFVMLMILWTFFNKRIPVEKKLKILLMVVILLASGINKVAYQVWHGFTMPFFFPARYGFCVIFFLICVSMEGMKYVYDKEIVYERKERIRLLIVVSIYFIFGICFSFVDTRIRKEYVIIMVALAIISFLLLNSNSRILKMIAIALVMVDLMINAGSISSQTMEESLSYSSYNDYIKNGENMIASFSDSPYGLYRVVDEKSDCVNHFVNDSFLFGYYGVTGFSSSLKTNSKNYLSSLGYDTDYVSVRRVDNVIEESDDYLGIRYIYSVNKEGEFRWKENEDANSLAFFESGDSIENAIVEKEGMDAFTIDFEPKEGKRNLTVTMPYDEGFKCYAGEKNLLINSSENGLMQIEVPGGVSELELDFRPKGIYVGLFISVMGVLLFVVFLIMEKKRLKGDK